MKNRNWALLGAVGMAGTIALCNVDEEEPSTLPTSSEAAPADPYDLLCDEKQGERLSGAIDGIANNREKIAERIAQQCKKDVRFCPPAEFDVRTLSRAVLTRYPLVCFGDTYDIGNAGALTIFDENNQVKAIGFTPGALNSVHATLSALSGMIAHEFGHAIIGSTLGHEDIHLIADSPEAPVDWIYGLGHATDFVCDGEATKAIQTQFMESFEGNSVDLAGRTYVLNKFKSWRDDNIAAKEKLKCATANTMHKIHSCAILDQRIAIIGGSIQEQEAALSAR